MGAGHSTDASVPGVATPASSLVPQAEAQDYPAGVSALQLRFVRGAVHLPELGLWLDAHERVGPGESVFVSHAHSDHTGRHACVLFSAPTQKLMRARVSGEREEIVLPFGHRQFLGASIDGTAAHLTLLPAGHIFGSAMSLVEAADESLLYTGDFKLRASLSAELCQPHRADVLIMETTFGRPSYVFPPAEEVIASMVKFCRETLAVRKIPVLLGYSLGKSQEILSGLKDAGLPVMLHAQAATLTRIYESFGVVFPEWRELDEASAAGHVVIAPPGTPATALRSRIADCRFAVLTGWALESGARFRYRADAAFPLSDHADFPDLVEFVRRVNPRKVLTLHGFAEDFATHLRGLGIDAQSLDTRPQMELGLSFELGHRLQPNRD